VAAARNVGVDAVRTPWICFLDADDYLVPSALQEMLDAAERIPEDVPGFIYPDFVAEFADGRQEAKRLDDWSQPRLQAQAIHGITALYPRKAFQDGIRFDEKLPGWEDWDLAFQLGDQGWCGYHLERPLFVYRMELGKRREDNYADRETNKAAIRTKWTRYIDGGATMPCRKCGGRAAGPQPRQQGESLGPSLGATVNQETVWVDYIGTLEIANTFKGQRSGTRYRFGGSRRGAFVLAQDADGFRERPHDFTVRTEKPSASTRAADVMLNADVQRTDAPAAVMDAPPAIAVEVFLRPQLLEMTVDDLRTILRGYGGQPARMRKEDLSDAILGYQERSATETEARESVLAQRAAAEAESGDRFVGRIPEDAPR
jgi:hypothetical protein